MQKNSTGIKREARKTSPSLKPAPRPNVIPFPGSFSGFVKVDQAKLGGFFTMNGDYLEDEFEIKHGDFLLVRNDLPLSGVSDDMLCIVDDGGPVVRQIIVHDSQHFTAIDLQDGENVLTSLRDTPLLGVIVAFQRSL
jgi:hypothetical protein